MIDTLSSINQPLERLIQQLMTTSVFGPPTTAGDTTIIPVSALMLGVGFGGGSGQGPARADETEPGGGGGGGGGAGGRLEPRGYIKVGPDGVRYEPIIDQSRIALAGIAMIAWNLFWISLTIRSVMKARARHGAGESKGKHGKAKSA